MTLHSLQMRTSVKRASTTVRRSRWSARTSSAPSCASVAPGTSGGPTGKAAWVRGPARQELAVARRRQWAEAACALGPGALCSICPRIPASHGGPASWSRLPCVWGRLCFGVRTQVEHFIGCSHATGAESNCHNRDQTGLET